MSQSPLERRGESQDYVLGWKALYDMARRGRSFSGRERNCAFLNLGDGGFADVSAVSGFNFPDDGRALALTDWDQDGSLDAWVASRSGPRLRFLANRVAKGTRWLAFRLRGVEVNRDGIGARVAVVYADGTRRWRTLHAGDGYLSQGSKWLHFGLGAKQVAGVEVLWPGDTKESFVLDPANAENARLWLEEGAGEARLDEAPRREIEFSVSEFEAEKPTERARIILARPIDAPRVRWIKPDGERGEIGELGGAPLLVNLWANWCVNCQREMQDLIDHREEIEARGIRIVALSLDENEARDEARAVIDRLQWPWDWGFVPAKDADLLTVLQRTVLSSDPDLVLPTSFLLDGGGRVTAIYRGPVEAEDLLADAALQLVEAADPRDPAVPFPGRWVWSAAPPDWVGYADRMAEHGHPAEAARYLARLMRSSDQALVGMGRELAELHVRVGDALLSEGDDKQALSLYRRGSRAHLEVALPHLKIARHWRAKNERRKAMDAYRAAVKAEPDNAEVHFEVGSYLAEHGSFEPAIEAFANAVRLDREHGLAHLNLGLALERSGQGDKALPALRAAVEVLPRRADVALLLVELLVKQDKTGEALKVLERARVRHPTDPQLLYQLGLLLVEADRLDEAERVLGDLRRTGSEATGDLTRRLRARGR